VSPSTSTSTWRRLGTLLLALAPGCAHTVTCNPPQPLASPAPAGTVDVTFLGAGGFLIQHGADVMLLGPFFTNPTMGELATQDFYSDGPLIKAFLPAAARDARAIVVGHAHYDHLMDVPYIAVKIATGATIYASDAAGKVLAPFAPELASSRFVSVETPPPGACAPGVTPCRIDVPGTSFRLWPIPSEHSAQFRGHGLFKDVIPPFTLWRGEPLKPLTTPPSRAGQWPEGTTFAYVIDVVEGGRPVFRAYYQDSGTRAPIGHPAESITDERKVDLALVCMGGYITLDHHPQELLARLQPDFVIASHWEDFFSPRVIPVPGKPLEPEKIRVLPDHSRRTFMRRVDRALPPDGRASFACPGLVTRFARNAAGAWTIESESGGGWPR
jgi:L-ascorbate metabolism protein UlaG (beta-lactamase superfamily)